MTRYAKTEYSWRDGWALTYPRTITKPTEIESVTRCLYCGAWTYMDKPCSACGTERQL